MDPAGNDGRLRALMEFDGDSEGGGSGNSSAAGSPLTGATPPTMAGAVLLSVPQRAGLAFRTRSSSSPTLGLSDLELSEGGSDDGYLSASSSMYSIHQLTSPLIHAIPSPDASPMLSLEEMQAQFFAGLPGLGQLPAMAPLQQYSAMSDDDLEAMLLQSMTESNLFFPPPAASVLGSMPSLPNPPLDPSILSTISPGPSLPSGLQSMESMNVLSSQYPLLGPQFAQPYNPTPVDVSGLPVFDTPSTSIPSSPPVASAADLDINKVKVKAEASDLEDLDNEDESKRKQALYQCPYPECGK
ncbi:hypothetical protein HK405_010692, partial [Cladochytrium tenue]